MEAEKKEQYICRFLGGYWDGRTLVSAEYRNWWNLLTEDKKRVEPYSFHKIINSQYYYKLNRRMKYEPNPANK